MLRDLHDGTLRRHANEAIIEFGHGCLRDKHGRPLHIGGSSGGLTRKLLDGPPDATGITDAATDSPLDGRRLPITPPRELRDPADAKRATLCRATRPSQAPSIVPSQAPAIVPTQTPRLLLPQTPPKAAPALAPAPAFAPVDSDDDRWGDWTGTGPRPLKMPRVEPVLV